MFWKLLQESVIVQSLLALSIVIFVGLKYLETGQISPELLAVLNLIIGFYFGSKVQISRKGG